MPYEVKISAPHRLGVVRLTGFVDGDTMLHSMETLYYGETWVPTFNTIWDCRPVIGITVDLSEVPAVLARMRALDRRMGKGRTAVVAPSEIVAAFVRMLFVRTPCAFRERRLVRTLDEALQWVVETYPIRVDPPCGQLPIEPI